MEKLYLGIDIGSTTFKAVLMNERGKVRQTLYQRTRPVDTGRVRCSGVCSRCGACNFGQLRQTVDKFLLDAGLRGLEDIACTVVTGSQIVEDTHDFLPYDFRVSEVTAHVAGARHYYPDCKAILDVGGQDSKAMVFNDRMKMWNYKMSGICAAGTGAFLDSVAAKLNVPIEEMASRVNYDSNLEFSSVCAVLSATSINKFKNRFPLGDIIGGACRAQARTVMSGVGELFLGYRGDIVFQGGVASNRAVAYYLREITGNNIVIPEFHGVMGALGAACLALSFSELKGRLEDGSRLVVPDLPLESAGLRARTTRRDFLGRGRGPLVWRNLFFPAELLNALGVRSLTLETYAALFARSQRKVKHAFDQAACKGFSGETCSFLRVLEGVELPPPAAIVSTSQPCQQGERIFRDLARNYHVEEDFFSLHTPAAGGAGDFNVEVLAEDLERSVRMLEKRTGLAMSAGRLAEACRHSNEARHYSLLCNELRCANPPLVRGGQMIYFATIFSQLWGRPELTAIQKKLYEELLALSEEKHGLTFSDTHRLLWLHLPPFYDRTLLDFLELRQRASIVFEEVNFIGWEPLDPADPYRSLARKLLTTGFMDPDLRVRSIAEQGRKFKINGCILYNHGFGRCSMADSSFIKHLREELNQAAVPLLVLDGDCVDTTIDPCSTETKISAYVEALNEQKYGNIFGRLKEE